MKARKIPNLTVKEYIDLEIESGIKYEYHDGEIYALAGGTINHGLICGNIFSEIRTRLKEKNSNCIPFPTDVKLNVGKSNSFVYPDSMVICDEIKSSEDDKNSITNPTLIIEVLSKSTADYDRGDKFYIYRQIPSFKEYVLIDQNRYIVDVHYKHENSDLWSITRYEGVDKLVKLNSLNIDIPMSDIYYRTKFEETK